MLGGAAKVITEPSRFRAAPGWTQCCTNSTPLVGQGVFVIGSSYYQHIFTSTNSCQQQRAQIDTNGNWGTISVINCPTSMVPPGSGNLESYDVYYLDNAQKLLQAAYRGNKGYIREVPVGKNGEVKWNQAGAWYHCCTQNPPRAQGGYIPSFKRGIGSILPGGNNLNDAQSCDVIRDLKGHWYQTWLIDPLPIANCNNILFIPKVYGEGNAVQLNNTRLEYAAKSGWLFTFNEPNVPIGGQAGMSMADAITTWHTLQQAVQNYETANPGKQIRIVAPATSQAYKRDWLNDMVNEYHTKYQTYPTFDGYAIHAYYSDTQNAKDYINQEIARFKSLPNYVEGTDRVWVAEFSGCAPNGIKNATGIMDGLVPWMESNPSIVGYSWFFTKLHTNLKGYAQECELILPNNSLSTLGTMYSNK